MTGVLLEKTFPPVPNERVHLELGEMGGSQIWGPVHPLVVIFGGYNGPPGAIVKPKFGAVKVKGG